MVTLLTLNPSVTRGHSLKFFKKQSRTTLRLNFFTQRVINTWKPTIALLKNICTVTGNSKDMDMNKGKEPKHIFVYLTVMYIHYQIIIKKLMVKQ